jgi:hypothetical protein
MNHSRVFSLLQVVVDYGEPYPIEENPVDATQFLLFNHASACFISYNNPSLGIRHRSCFYSDRSIKHGWGRGD